MQIIANGLMQGSVYALAAVGLVLIFGVVRVPHFAHGESIMVSAMTTVILSTTVGLPVWLSILLGAAAATALGVVLAVGVFNPLREYPLLALLIVSLALVLIISGAALELFGDNPRTAPAVFPGSVNVLGARVPAMGIVIFAAGGVLTLLLQLLIKRTRPGRAMRAMALNPYAAQLVGIPSKRYAALAFAIGSLLAGIAGGLLSTVSPVFATMGALLALKAFVVIIFAGMGSIGGALAGGLLLGIAEATGASLLHSGYQDAYAFIFLIAVLVIRPEGLFRQGFARD